MKQVFTLLIWIMMTTNNYAQQWIDNDLYPFESKYACLDAGNMHYIDEGKGEVILFVHGTPTWSFLYRQFVKELSQNYRCIAIDHIGFGLSEKNDQFSGAPEDHAKNLSEFITKLDLNEITLVVHDFGGPIGLGATLMHPDRVKKIVLMNSWLWETKNNAEAQKIDKLLHGWLGKSLYLNFNFSPKVLLKKAFSDKKNLTKLVHQHYIKPFPSKQSRLPLLNIGQALVGSSDWYQKQWEQLDKLEDKEWLILWGAEDPFISTQYLKKWTERLPEAEIKEFQCGHFVQEEKAEDAIKEISEFLKLTVNLNQ